MSEQQYRVVADRATIGDKVDFETWDAGDLLVYRYSGRSNHPGELVRIERPVPTTSFPAPMHLTDAEADSFHAAMQETGLPTREQIAEALAQAEGPDGFRSWEQIADAVLALFQNGADRD